MKKVAILAILTMAVSLLIAFRSGTGTPSVQAQPTTQAVTCTSELSCEVCSSNLFPRGNQNIEVVSCSDGTTRIIPIGRCGEDCI